MTINLPETAALADRLQKSLAFADVTPAQMADRLGLTSQTIQAWLQGRAAPRLPHLMVWAQTCHIPFEWLTGTESDPARTRP